MIRVQHTLARFDRAGGAPHAAVGIGDPEIGIDAAMFDKSPQELAACRRFAIHDLRRVREQSQQLLR